MWWFQTIMAVYGAVSSKQASDKQAANQERAAAAAEDLGRQNAAAAESELQEQMRRTKLEQSATEASAKSKAAASGTTGGSMQEGISNLISENERQLDWMERAGKNRQRIILAGGATAGNIGRSAADATRARGTANLLKDAGTVASTGRKADIW